jgi:hypothetical protein
MSIIKPLLFGTGAIVSAVIIGLALGAGTVGITIQSGIAQAPAPAIVDWN